MQDSPFPWSPHLRADRKMSRGTWRKLHCGGGTCPLSGDKRAKKGSNNTLRTKGSGTDDFYQEWSQKENNCMSVGGTNLPPRPAFTIALSSGFCEIIKTENTSKSCKIHTENQHRDFESSSQSNDYPILSYHLCTSLYFHSGHIKNIFCLNHTNNFLFLLWLHILPG